MGMCKQGVSHEEMNVFSFNLMRDNSVIFLVFSSVMIWCDQRDRRVTVAG
jgi:hypothetical protein